MSSSVIVGSSTTCSSSSERRHLIWKPLVIENDIVCRWYPTPDDGFLDPPVDEEEHAALQSILSQLPDGSTLPCRGRDRIGLCSDRFTEWSYGVCIKYTAMTENDGLAPSAALRAAQSGMARDSRWQAPYYWAAFSLHGEWR